MVIFINFHNFSFSPVIWIINIGILASTKASDMQAIIDAIESKELNAKISVVISDKEDAYALERARKRSIKAVFIDPKAGDILKEEDGGKRRELFDKKVSKELEKNNVELILAIGYMRIISPWLVNKYRSRIMNIHPSLLPKFAGGMDKDVHQAVLDAKEKVTGCTLHFVDESVDGGPIIMQKRVKINKNETAGTLREKVQKAEQEIIIKAIKLYSEGKIKVESNKVVIR
mgnify:CR=1 FL=1